MSKDDFTTPEGARAWALSMRDMARAQFERDEELAPQAVFIMTRDEKTGRKHPKPTLLMSMIASDVINGGGQAKNNLGLWLRRIARRTAAIGYCFMSEAWVITDVDIRPRGSWENVPGRREVVRVGIEHVALGDTDLHYVAEVTRKKGKVTLAPWDETVGKIDRKRSRLLGILPDREEREKVAESTEGLLATGADLTPEQRRYHIERARERLLASGFTEADVDHTQRALIAELEEHGHIVAPGPPRPSPSVDVIVPPEGSGLPLIEVVKIAKGDKR